MKGDLVGYVDAITPTFHSNFYQSLERGWSKWVEYLRRLPASRLTRVPVLNMCAIEYLLWPVCELDMLTQGTALRCIYPVTKSYLRAQESYYFLVIERMHICAFVNPILWNFTTLGDFFQIFRIHSPNREFPWIHGRALKILPGEWSEMRGGPPVPFKQCIKSIVHSSVRCCMMDSLYNS
jgi:hypothetical protein